MINFPSQPPRRIPTLDEVASRPNAAINEQSSADAVSGRISAHLNEAPVPMSALGVAPQPMRIKMPCSMCDKFEVVASVPRSILPNYQSDSFEFPDKKGVYSIWSDPSGTTYLTVCVPVAELQDHYLACAGELLAAELPGLGLSSQSEPVNLISRPE